MDLRLLAFVCRHAFIEEKTVTTEAIRPRYADSFRCIGPECEDTCCQGWSVFIDKPAYAKYQTIPDGPLRTIIKQHLECTGNASDFEYAQVKLNSAGVCPFLSEDRLCAIQKEHGESYLSLTCSQYPRVRKTADGIEERTLLLSCPEAARLVLLDQQLVPLKENGQSTGSRYHELSANNTTSSWQASTPLSYFLPVRNFAVLLLQDRSYPLWQRVFLLNMFCKRMEALTDRQEWNRIPTLLSEHSGIIAGGSLRVALNAIPAQTLLQLGIVMTLIEERASSGKNQRFAECIEDFARGIGYQPGSTAIDLVQNYIDAYDGYYAPWLEKHGFMLENYLLNYVFGHLFPFGKGGHEQGLHAHRESHLLCIQYALIKGLLVGMAGYYQSSFSSDHVVKLIQSFSKAVEHNAGLLLRIENFFEINGLKDTQGIAALLRDGLPYAPAQAPIVTAQIPISPL